MALHVSQLTGFGGGGGTQPQFASVSTIAESNSSTVAAGYPSGIVAGNLLVLMVSCLAGTTRTVTTMNTPAGWTAITNAKTGETTIRAAALFYKIATGSESGTFNCTATLSGADVATTFTAASVARYTGNATSGTIVESGGANGGASTTPAPANITTTNAQELAICGIAWDGAIGTIGAISGATGGTWTESAAEQLGPGPQWSHDFQHAAMPSAGSLTGGTATLSSSTNWKTLTAALLPG